MLANLDLTDLEHWAFYNELLERTTHNWLQIPEYISVLLLI